MKKTNLVPFATVLVALNSCTFVDIHYPEHQKEKEVQVEVEGFAYKQSVSAALLAGQYGRGDKEWEEKNDEWLNSDKDDPYPDELRDIDGNGYHDSRDAGSGEYA